VQCSGSIVCNIKEVVLCQAWLVLGWTSIIHIQLLLQENLSWYVTSHQSTQPGHPFEDRHNQHHPMGSDVLQLRSKGRYGSCLVAGRTV